MEQSETRPNALGYRVKMTPGMATSCGIQGYISPLLLQFGDATNAEITRCND